MSEFQLTGSPIVREAEFSPCRKFRYSLTRRWAEGPLLGWIMLNPSTAYEMKEDRTISRVIGFSKREGAAGCYITNLFPYRTAYPAELWAAKKEAWGDMERSAAAYDRMNGAGFMRHIVAAWGHQPGWRYESAADIVQSKFAPRLRCLGLSKHGAPRHPLYIAADKPFEDYRP